MLRDIIWLSLGVLTSAGAFIGGTYFIITVFAGPELNIALLVMGIILQGAGALGIQVLAYNLNYDFQSKIYWSIVGILLLIIIMSAKWLSQ